METIELNVELISLLLSQKCITEEQNRLIHRQRSKRNRNAVFLRILKTFDDAKCSNFVACLRQTKQTAIATIVENGGGSQFSFNI